MSKPSLVLMVFMRQLDEDEKDVRTMHTPGGLGGMLWSGAVSGECGR